MKRTNWPVVEGDNRPAGPPDKCFFCGEPHGAQHKEGCAIRTRTIVVRATIEYVVDVPEHWEQRDIEFHRNEGSWCASNGIAELAELEERLGEGCACHLMNYAYVREATKEDEEASAWIDPHHPAEAQPA